MKAEDLRLTELVDFAEGNISFYGRRLVLHSSHAIAKFRNDLLEMLGEDHARRMFTRFGYFWGQADAAAMRRILDWDNVAELLRAGARMHTLWGASQVVLDKMEFDEPSGKFYMEVTWVNSGEAEEHLRESGWSKKPVCWKMVGYASGYASFCMGRSIYFIEKDCRAKGDSVCTAIGRDQESWGDEIKAHLPFFEAEDIRGDVERLSRELKKKMKELAREREQLDSFRQSRAPFFMEYRSRALQKVLDLAERVAQFDSSVLITGETGVGKEVLAHYIHNNSHRSKGPFVTVNCGALPETLLESELFGHKAGSFTGAIRDREGLLEQAGAGTIFLDEIGDISLNMQLKILRVLQEKEITRVGENKPRKIDVRVIAATNKILEKTVAEGSFREDLLYRLRVIEIGIPPLRERKEDILPLARYLVERLARRLNIPRLRLDSTCIDYLNAYNWPGNVRELENALERGAVLSKEGVILPNALPQNIISQTPLPTVTDASAIKPLANLEREYIRAVLQAAGGNKQKAARLLGISSTTLWRRLKSMEKN